MQYYAIWCNMHTRTVQRWLKPQQEADLGQELEEVALNLPAIQLEGVVAIRSRFGVVAVQRPVALGCHPYHPLTKTSWLKSLLKKPTYFRINSACTQRSLKKTLFWMPQNLRSQLPFKNVAYLTPSNRCPPPSGSAEWTRPLGIPDWCKECRTRWC